MSLGLADSVNFNSASDMSCHRRLGEEGRVVEKPDEVDFHSKDQTVKLEL